MQGKRNTTFEGTLWDLLWKKETYHMIWKECVVIKQHISSTESLMNNLHALHQPVMILNKVCSEFEDDIINLHMWGLPQFLCQDK